MNMQKPAAILLLLGYLMPAFSADTGDFYGAVSATSYLSGDFVAAKHPDFVKIQGIKQANPNRRLWLRKDAAGALQKMLQAFRQHHPDVPFVITSASRSFAYQRGIWERKWRRNRGIKDQRQRLLKTLQFSAMPGASRHHWGTEFDLWPLENSYYKKGKGLVLYNWLRENAMTYGYCQPYTAGRAEGHNEERWHWSYKPMAKVYLQQWLEYFSHNQGAGNIYVSKYPETATIYMGSVSAQCK